MKRHHGNLLARPSLRTMATHFVREGKDACVLVWTTPKQGTKKNRRTKRKQANRGGLEVMLTVLFIVAYFFHAAFILPMNRFKILSHYTASVCCGIVVALLLVTGFAQWPSPTEPLELSGLLSVPDSSDYLAWAEESGEEEGSQIPPELYPNYIDPMVQDPLVVAAVALPGETWREPREEEIPLDQIEIAALSSSALTPVEEKVKPDVKPLKEKPVAQVPLSKGVYHQIRAGDNMWDLARAYGVSHNKLVVYNQNIDPSRLMPGQKVFIPGADSPVPQTPKKQRMALPIQGRDIYVISEYGLRKHPIGGDIRFHRGVDLQPVYIGKPVYAVLDGVVTYSGPRGGKGLVIQLKHENGIETIYAHNSQLLVKRGEKVKQNQQIAKAGSTGYSTGPHLHFEVWENGKHVNPMKYLPKMKSPSTRSYYSSSRKR